MSSIRRQLTEHARAKDAASGREFAVIEGAADLTSALAENAPVPALYIVRPKNKRDDNTRTETITDTYLAVLVVRNVRSSRGDDSSDEIERLSKLLQRYLKDFKPVFEDADQVEHRFDHLKLKGGYGGNFADQKLAWVDGYEFQYARRCC